MPNNALTLSRRIANLVTGSMLLAATVLTPPAAAQAAPVDPETQGFFWGVVSGVGQRGGTCEQFSQRLEQVLTAMPDTTLKRFADGWADWWADSYRWDLWGAAYIINGGASDDGFDYFRGWLVTRGYQQWDRARRDPDSAFDDVKPGTLAECEEVVVVLPNTYEARFHEEAPDRGAREPAGNRWTESDLPQRYPKLSRRFSGS